MRSLGKFSALLLLIMVAAFSLNAQESSIAPGSRRSIVPRTPAHLASSNGRYDLIALTQSSSLHVLLGNGDGTFSAGNTLTTGLQNSYFADHSVVIADFNGDNKPDIAVCDQGGNTISVFLGNGDGTFGARRTVTVGTTPLSMSAIDYDRDGRIDLAVANGFSNSVSILHGDGTGSFIVAQTINVPGGPQGIGIADFNADGYADIAVANNDSNSMSIIYGSSSGTFGTATSFPVSRSPISISVADFTGDGKADIAVCSYDSSVTIFRNSSIGFSTDSVTLLTAGIYAPTSIASADFDRTNGEDIAVANYLTNSVTVRLNAGVGVSFQAARTTNLSFSPDVVTAADIDGDGFVDIIASGYDGSYSVLKNDGTAHFSVTQTAFVGNQLLAAALGDVNGDRSDIPVNELGLDDNRSYDLSFGFSGGTSGFGWFNQLTPVVYPSTLAQVRVRFADPISIGTQVRLVVYADPENNGPESGQPPVYSQSVSVIRDADNWSTLTLSPSVSITSGSFVAGIIDDQAAGLSFPGTCNKPGLSSPPGSRSFETSNSGITFHSMFSRGKPGYYFSFLIRGVIDASTPGISTSAGRFSSGIPTSTWVLMSVPYSPYDPSASSIASQFTGGSPYKMYAYASGSFQDITGATDAFQLGRGFWFKTATQPGPFNLSFGAGDLELSSAYQITIPTGWSLVGPPFTTNSTTWNPVNTSAGSVGIRVYGFSHETNSWQGPLDPSVQPMQQFGGYAVWNGTASSASFTFLRGPTATPIAEWKHGDGWFMKLNVGPATIRVGQHRNASVTHNSFNYPMPLSPPERSLDDPYLEGKLWSDIRPVQNQELLTWKVFVDPTTAHSIKLKEKFGVPTNWKIVAQGIPYLSSVDLTRQDSVHFPGEMSFPFTMTIVAGPADRVDQAIVPSEFALFQNYPNPFNPSTTIRYQLNKESEVTLKIFNTAGQEIVTLLRGAQQPGYYEMRWDGKNSQGFSVPSGVYFYRIRTAGEVQTRKMLVLK